jgi:hypothetical protein
MVGDEGDENGSGFNTRTIVLDFLDLDNPQFHFSYFGPTAAIDHNGYVKGDKYYLANYRAGIRVIDISDIENGNMVEEGYFDSYPASNSAGFSGAWNVYPFFASGNIVISDLNRGFFLVKSALVDTTDPVAVCQNYTAELDENGDVTIVGEDVDGGSTDNSGFVTLTVTPNVFDCSDLGTNIVTLTATDPSGNTDTCTATVTVVDTRGPVFDCYQNETVPYDQGQSFYTLPDYVGNGDVSAADNCTTSLTIAQDPVAGTELTAGTYSISFESTDDEGNNSNCSFELTVVEILSVEDGILSEGLSIFPNPSSEFITIVSEYETLSSIDIIDISGKRLISVSNLDTERQNIDISSFATGIYFVNVNNQITKKIVKE